jgi:integrase
VRHHKASGRAYVTVDGRQVYLGAWGSDEARRAYRDVVAQWEAANSPASPRPSTIVTVAELVLAHYEQAKGRYSADELRAYRVALSPFLRRHMDRDVETILGRDLAEQRDAWRLAGLRRQTINKMLGRLKRVFVWGAQNEYVSETTAGRVRMVAGLRDGEAPDYEQVHPVPLRAFAATLRQLDRTHPMLAAVARVQYYCGARPGEVCRMRGDELHTGSYRVEGRTIVIPDGVTVFAPTRHKVKRKGHHVAYTLGPRAVAALAPHRRGGYLFTLGKRECVDPVYYASVIAKACEAAGVDRWSPNQLRHNFLTRMDVYAGIELGSAAVRHRSLATTAIYVDRDLGRVADVARKIG